MQYVSYEFCKHFSRVIVFLQIENLTCPLMYIEGRDDLNAASTENANLVDCLSFFLFFFQNELGRFVVYIPLIHLSLGGGNPEGRR